MGRDGAHAPGSNDPSAAPMNSGCCRGPRRSRTLVTDMRLAGYGPV